MEARLFDPDTVPEYVTAEWYLDRESVAHLEQHGHRERILQAAMFVKYLADKRGARTVVDLGCGDGGLLSLLAEDPRLEAWGYDLCPANVAAAAARGVRVELRDVVADEPRWADVAVMTEMLEHLLDPHEFLTRARQHCRGLVASSPWDETEAEHYEFHTWAWDPNGYREVIEGAGWTVLFQEPVKCFQVVIACA